MEAYANVNMALGDPSENGREQLESRAGETCHKDSWPRARGLGSAL